MIQKILKLLLAVIWLKPHLHEHAPHLKQDGYAKRQKIFAYNLLQVSAACIT